MGIVKTALVMLGLGLCLIFILAWNVSADGTGNYPAPENGDWVIENETKVWNETIVLNGNLSIEDGGNLSFRNVTLKMNCSEDGEYGIVVNDGGGFYILDYDYNPETTNDRSNITANIQNSEFGFLVDSNAEFEMMNSELSWCGYEDGEDGRASLTIKTDNTRIMNSSFYENFCGIYIFYSNNNTISNNYITNNNPIHQWKSYGIKLVESENNQITRNKVSKNWKNGIDLYYSSNNIISNNNISSNYGNGIYLFCSNNNIILNNNIYSNIINGIHLYSSDNTIFTNNSVYSNNNYGIYISSSNKIKMRDNTINNNKYNFDISSTDNDIDTSNTINGKSIYYIKHQNNLLFDNSMSIGYLGLISCSNITVKNLSLANNSQGILFMNTTDSVIENCELSNNYYGISFKSSNNNQIINSKAFKNYYGIFFSYSSKNKIKNSNISDNDDGVSISFLSNNNQFTYNNISRNEYGIGLGSNKNEIRNNNIFDNNKGIYVTSTNCTITNNNIFNNNYGIHLFSSFLGNNTISNNHIFNNGNGICIQQSHNNKIVNNNVSNNDNGIFLLGYSKNNQITYNTLYSNNNNGIRLSSSSNNQIGNNNIYNNNDGIYLYASSNNNQIINNSIYNNDENGIYLYSSSNNNQILNNSIYSNNDDGISLWASKNNQIKNNNISNNRNGVYFIDSSNNNQIINNDVFRNYNGIFIYSSSNNNQITNNTIYDSYSDGILIGSSNNNTIINSTIFNSSDFDLYFWEKSNITAINTTFNKNRVYFDDEDTEFINNWYLFINVLDKNKKPILNAKVRIQDNENDTYDVNFTTDSNGFINWIVCTEYIENKNCDKTYFTPHIINVTKDEKTTEISININESKTVIIFLEKDTTSPQIYDVKNNTPTGTSVTITWTTNELSASLVKYGLDDNYGLSEYNALLTTSHSITLTELDSETFYHFCVNSTDESGNSNQIGDFTFLTLETIPLEELNLEITKIILPENAIENENITVEAKIKNIGNISISNFSVTFYFDDKKIGNLKYEKILEPTKEASVNIIWQAIIGNHTIKIEIETSEGELLDSKESTEKLEVKKSEPKIEITKISFQKQALEGQEITINATIKNIGTVPISNFIVNFYYGEKLIYSFNISSIIISGNFEEIASPQNTLGIGEEITIEFEWKAIVGNNTIIVEVISSEGKILASKESEEKLDVIKRVEVEQEKEDKCLILPFILIIIIAILLIFIINLQYGAKNMRNKEKDEKSKHIIDIENDINKRLKRL